MTISQSTTVQAYQLNAGGTRARMAILRMIAADNVNNRNEHTRLQPGDWRGARHYKLTTWRDAYCAGLHQCVGQWYTHGGEQFRNERDAHDVVARRHTRWHTGWHTGWHTDTEGQETAVGIVVSLSHGRFIAGYRWTSNDERVYFPEVFTDERDAARMADEHARVFAESAREDSERFDAMTDAEGHAESVAADVAMAYQARNVSPKHREHCRNRIEELRAARDDLASATRDYNRGA